MAAFTSYTGVNHTLGSPSAQPARLELVRSSLASTQTDVIYPDLNQEQCSTVWQTFINKLEAERRWMQVKYVVKEYFRICILVKCKIVKRTARNKSPDSHFQQTSLKEHIHANFSLRLTSHPSVYYLYLHVGYLHSGVAEGVFTMASFEIATKANMASVLPGFVGSTPLQQEQTSLLPTVSKNFHDGATLPSKGNSYDMQRWQELRMIALMEL
jgi:hypothetical protein